MAVEAAENIARASRRSNASIEVLESVEMLVLVVFRGSREDWGACGGGIAGWAGNSTQNRRLRGLYIKLDLGHHQKRDNLT
jgi:hypothetical protein